MVVVMVFTVMIIVMIVMVVIVVMIIVIIMVVVVMMIVVVVRSFRSEHSIVEFADFDHVLLHIFDCLIATEPPGKQDISTLFYETTINNIVV